MQFSKRPQKILTAAGVMLAWFSKGRQYRVSILEHLGDRYLACRRATITINGEPIAAWVPLRLSRWRFRSKIVAMKEVSKFEGE